MITKDINGNNLPASYDDFISADSRDFAVKIKVNGSDLACAVSSMSIVKGSCGADDNFSVGSVISSTLDIELTDLSTTLKGKTIEVQVGLNLGSDYTYITVGTFKAVDVKKTAYATTVVAYGHTMASMAGSFTIPSTLSLANIASAIRTATGVDIAFDAGIDTSKVLAIALPEACSCYNALQIMASVCGGYAVDTYDGKIAIKTYSSITTVAVEAGRMLKLPDVSETPFTITGVEVTATGQDDYRLTTDTVVDPDKTYYIRSGTAPNYVYTEVEDPVQSQLSTYYERFDVTYTYGSPVVLYDENPYMSAGLFDNYKSIVGYSYYYGDITLSLGDPRIEGIDVLEVTDVDESVYIVPCHEITHNYDGGWSTFIQSSNPTTEGEDIPSNTPISQRLDNIANSAQLAQSYAEQAQQSAHTAQQSAQSAQQSAQSAVDQATIAYNKAVEVNTLAQQANQNAQEAQQSASIAYGASQASLNQLALVEDVIGTLNWIAQHGIYVACTETEVIVGKTYYTLAGTAISNPTGNPSKNGYYELVSGVYVLSEDIEVDSQKTYYQVTASEVAEPSGDPSTIPYYQLEVDEAVTQYINTHLSLTDRGLSVTDGSQSSMLISSDGVTIYGSTGQIVGQYGEGAIIGNIYGYHIEMSGDRLSFMNGTGQSATEIAYMAYNELYIPRVVVVDSMKVGKWIWDAMTAENHLTLKWEG